MAFLLLYRATFYVKQGYVSLCWQLDLVRSILVFDLGGRPALQQAKLTANYSGCVIGGYLNRRNS